MLDERAGATIAPAIVELYIATSGGEPMTPHDTLRAIEGRGIEGDRYANGTGYWSYERRYVSHMTFIERETIERVARAIDAPFTGAESRRNAVTVGVRLLDLIGKRFRIGEAEFEGERDCEPCRYIETLLGKPVRVPLARDGGGLRAHIVGTGTIARGDRILITA